MNDPLHFFRCKSWSFNFICVTVQSLLGSSIAVRKFCLTYVYHQHSLCNYCLIHIICRIVFSKAITSWHFFFFFLSWHRHFIILLAHKRLHRTNSANLALYFIYPCRARGKWWWTGYRDTYVHGISHTWTTKYIQTLGSKLPMVRHSVCVRVRCVRACVCVYTCSH